MNKLLQYVLFSAMFLYCMGYAFHWAFEPKTAPATSEPAACTSAPNESDALKQKFELIAHTDYEEYLKLKTDAEKYKKADEILGKIMAIFMADLGIHLKEKAQASAAATPSATPLPSQSGASVTNVHTSSPPAYTRAASKTVSEELSHLPVEGQSDFLKRTTFSDAKQSLFSAAPLNASGNELRGCYRGVLNVPSRRNQQMKLWFGGKSSSSAEVYKYMLQENGKPTTAIGSSTQNRLLSASTADQNEFIFYPAIGSYFQIFYLKSSRKLIGNYYEQQADTGFQVMGTINLQKTSDCAWINESPW